VWRCKKSQRKRRGAARDPPRGCHQRVPLVNFGWWPSPGCAEEIGTSVQAKRPTVVLSRREPRSRIRAPQKWIPERDRYCEMSSGARDSFSIAHLLARPQQPVCPADSSAGQHHHEFVGSAAALFQRTMLPVPPAEEVHGVDSTSPSIGADSEGKVFFVSKCRV
jgi:hypothetical protein